MNAVPCLTWVKRGVCKPVSERVKLSESELSSLVHGMNGAKLREDDSEEEEEEEEEDEGTEIEGATGGEAGGEEETSTTGKRKLKSKKSIKKEEEDDIIKRYDLSDYSSGDDEEESEDGEEEGGMLSMKGLSYFSSNKEDPYMKAAEDSADEDEDDMRILPGDNLIAMGKIKGDHFNLEVFLYNEADGTLFCHHDTILASFPLCMEWVGFDPGEPKTDGNLLCIGNVTPNIELWDVDIVDTLEPAFVLEGTPKLKGKKKKAKKVTIQGHRDAVLGLSWNALQPRVLASASADFTCGLWDLQDGKMVSRLTDHKEKVQAVQWHPCEAQTLLTGSFDLTAKVFDCRSPDKAVRSWEMPGEVERVLWNSFDPFYFFTSTDTGHLYYMDVRTDMPVYTLKAHTKEITGLTLSKDRPGCLVTSSMDKLVKVWDVRDNKPQEIMKKDLQVGEVHCAQACPDSGLIFAVGGERELRVLNLSKTKEVNDHFSSSSRWTRPVLEPTEVTTVGEPGLAESMKEDMDMFGDIEAGASTEAGSSTTGGEKKKKKKKKKTKKAPMEGPVLK